MRHYKRLYRLVTRQGDVERPMRRIDRSAASSTGCGRRANGWRGCPPATYASARYSPRNTAIWLSTSARRCTGW